MKFWTERGVRIAWESVRLVALNQEIIRLDRVIIVYEMTLLNPPEDDTDQAFNDRMAEWERQTKVREYVNYLRTQCQQALESYQVAQNQDDGSNLIPF